MSAWWGPSWWSPSWWGSWWGGGSGPTPPSLNGQFGLANITIYSPTGLPVNLTALIQNTSCIVQIAYFNALGQPFVPESVTWQVDDVASGQSLVSPQTLTPGLTNNFVITSSQNGMINSTRSFEVHQVLFTIVDQTGEDNYARQEFEILRTVGTVSS